MNSRVFPICEKSQQMTLVLLAMLSFEPQPERLESTFSINKPPTALIGRPEGNWAVTPWVTAQRPPGHSGLTRLGRGVMSYLAHSHSIEKYVWNTTECFWTYLEVVSTLLRGLILVLGKWADFGEWPKCLINSMKFRVLSPQVSSGWI